jgi:TonB family protein
MTLWHYLLLVNLYLSLFFGFYMLLLRRETFFQLNRIYLISAALLSFFIPLIQSEWVKGLFITEKVQYAIYSNQVMITDIAPIKDSSVTLGQLLIILYTCGVLFLTARLIVQLVLLNRIINNPAPSAAYSFFNKIKVNDDMPGKDVIIQHEEVHARQFHSADVLIIEAVMIINWFNPVVYLYRFAIKHIHEFIADRQALDTGTDKTEYALLLLSQTFNTPAHQLANPFYNHSLLKLRIMMLHKNRSQRIKLIKYGLSAPLFILMLVLSSATINNSKTVNSINKKAEQVLLQPASAIISKQLPKRVPAKMTFTKEQPQELELVPDTVPGNKTQVFTAVEHSPSFPGGDKAFGKYLGEHVKYPAEARSKNIQGRVIITFIVEEDGSLTNLKLLRGIGGGANEEAMRVLAASPKWTPGMQNGRKVRVQYTVPIAFSLSPDGPVKSTGSLPVAKEDAMGYKADTGNVKHTVITFTKPGTPAPLYIIDGKEKSYAAMQVINPKNIESISVLKDKDAKAIYGNKGANGVILVTTKTKL